MEAVTARIREFERALAARAVDAVEPFSGGAAYLTRTLPAVWDLNFLWLEAARGRAAGELAATAERLQGGAGLAHRRIVVPDGDEGARLAPGFRALEWKPERYLQMVAGKPPSPPGGVRVEELPLARLRELRARLAREAPDGRTPAVVEQLVEASGRHSRAGNARHFAVLVAGEPVAAADLYSDKRTAQVEDVATLEEHRGRGYASAIVLHAVAAARETGHDLVFLLADADDWPRELYRRLGFEEIGAAYVFTHTRARV